MTVVAADSVQVSHIAEATSGVTPATPAFDVWRLTGESLSFQPTTLASTELGSTGRFQRPSSVTGSSVSGDLNFELAKFTALEDAMAGVLANPWGEGPLTPGSAGGAISAGRNTVGRALQTYTIEKRWPNADATLGAMPVTAVASGAPGASADVDIANGGAGVLGTGVVVIDYQTDVQNAPTRITIPIAVGDTDTEIADKATALNASHTYVTISNVAGTITFTATGSASTVDVLESRAGANDYVYQRYRGCTYSAMSFTTSPGAVVTGSATVVAGSPELDSLPLVGSTYVDAGSNDPMTASEVMDLTVGSAVPDLITTCWSSLTLNLDSSNREIFCIGHSGSRETALGTFTASMSGEIYFSGNQEVLRAMLANEKVGDSKVVFADADGNMYRFDLYDTKVTSGSLSAGGQNQDVTIPITVEPSPVTVQTDSGEDWNSGLIVSTVNTDPTLP